MIKTELNVNGSIDIIETRGKAELIITTLTVEQVEELYEKMKRQDMEERVMFVIKDYECYDNLDRETFDDIVTDLLYQQEGQFEDEDILDAVNVYTKQF